MKHLAVLVGGLLLLGTVVHATTSTSTSTSSTTSTSNTIAPVSTFPKNPGKTLRYGLDYGSTEGGNRSLDKIDRALTGGDASMMIAYCATMANTGDEYLATVAAPSLLGIDAYARAVNDATCQSRGSATEATASLVISADVTVNVTGMVCQMSTTPAKAASFQLRVGQAAANLACSMVTPAVLCAATTRTPIPVLAGTKVSVKATSTDDESAVGGLCQLLIQIPN